jgi:hypothetical protein
MDMNKSLIRIVGLLCLALTGGCATSSNVTVNPGTALQVRTAYVVLHQGQSSDMDANIQRELMAHGVQVKAGPEIEHPGTDILVRYSDDWKWDMAMYLRSLDIQVYDASTGTLVASGSWKNSVLHGFHGSEGVVKGVMDQIFVKLTGHT